MKKIKPGLVLELVANLLLSWLAYRLALPHWGEVGALYASAAPPLVWSLVEFVRTRRVDALSALVLFGIALSILTFALGGSARILLVRESLAAGAMGIVFLSRHFLSGRSSFILRVPRSRVNKKAARVTLSRTGATAHRYAHRLGS